MIAKLSSFLTLEHKKGDKLIDELREFEAEAVKKSEQIGNELEWAVKFSVELTEFFGEPAGPQCQWDDLFNTLKEFLELWKQSQENLAKIKAAAEKERKKREAAERKKRGSVKSSSGSQPSLGKSESNSTSSSTSAEAGATTAAAVETTGEAAASSNNNRNVSDIFEEMAAADPKAIMEQLKARRAARRGGRNAP
eukprot:TRINITY_DN876_c0_g1_i4.p1 TRINITY_DN876_c0_g1~~TRINITY_DN876_c0_g1_i4.p1  ORF type:complete len:195 (+),score=75.33 TRINITY_DN876_c0_g1_i4:1200-1784(+)